MATSGETPIATTSDTAVTLLTLSDYGISKLVIINEEGVAGFFSIDSGTEWLRWPSGATSIDIGVMNTAGQLIQWKRPAGGTNATKLYAWGY